MKGETDFPKIVGVATNICVAILCLTLSVAVVKKFVWAEQPQAPPGQIRPGDRVSLPSVKLGPGDTVVLALREGCHFCEASTPLYKQLVEAAHSGNAARVVAVLPEPPDKARNYLHSLGVEVTDVYNVPLSQLQVKGTPTLLLLSDSGIVKRAWYGQQPSEQNARIVREIFGGS